MAFTKTEKGFALQVPSTGLFFDANNECYLTGEADTCTIFPTVKDAAEASTWDEFELDLQELRPVPIERVITATVGQRQEWPTELLAELNGMVDGDEEGEDEL